MSAHDPLRSHLPERPVVCCFVTNWIELDEKLGSVALCVGGSISYSVTHWSCGSCVIDNNVSEVNRQREQKLS